MEPNNIATNNTYIYILIGVPLFLLLLFYVLSTREPPINKKCEYYIKEAIKSLNDITVTSNVFISLAQNYLKTKKNMESSVNTSIIKAKDILQTVKNSLIDAEKAYANTPTDSSKITYALTSSEEYANISSMAYTNIMNIIELPENQGNILGKALVDIQKQNNIVLDTYKNTENIVITIKSSYENIVTSQKIITTSFKNANEALDTLMKIVKSLTSDLENTQEYINLKKNIYSASQLLIEIEGLNASLSEENKYKNTINSMIINLNTSISTGQSYLNNTLIVFEKTTDDASLILSSKIPELLSILNQVTSYIGDSSSSSQNTITYYFNNITIIYKNLLSNYNVIIGYYNVIIQHVNNIKKLTEKTVGGLTTDINNFNNNLTSVEQILKKVLSPDVTFPVNETMPVVSPRPDFLLLEPMKPIDLSIPV